MKTETKITPAEQATRFIDRCNALGWRVERITDEVVTIAKRFTPGDNSGLVECDMEYYDLLSLCPNRGGSVWGTDCGGLGAISALNSGVFRMNKSGSGAKRFAANLVIRVGDATLFQLCIKMCEFGPFLCMFIAMKIKYKF